MATITKISGVIENKELPIITPNGFVTNYYFGSFANALASHDVEIDESDRIVIEQFINKGIQEDWIKFIKYYTIFYGTSEHKDAALVPLIDNVDGYQMTEENENLNDNIFNVEGGKVIGIGGEDNTVATYIPTPVSGNCSMIVSFKTPSTLSSARQYFVSKRNSSSYIKSIRVLDKKPQLFYLNYNNSGESGGPYTVAGDVNYLMLYGIVNTSSTKAGRRRCIYKNGEKVNVGYVTSGIDAISSSNNDTQYKYDIITRDNQYNVLKNLIYSVGLVDATISEETANKIFDAIIELETGLGKYTLPSNE